MFPIGELQPAMKYFVEENGKTYSIDPELPIYSYSCNPAEGEKRLRFDIVSGSTRYTSLIREYFEGSREICDRLFEKGVRAIMMVMTRPEGMSDRDFLDFRYKVEDRLQDLFDRSEIKGALLGGAYAPTTGRAYIDLLIYDGHWFVDYLKQPGVIDRLFALDDGTVCQTTLKLENLFQSV